MKSIVVDCMTMNGESVTLNNFYPIQAITGQMFLSYLSNRPEGSIPLKSLNDYYDSFVRVVELIEHPVGVNGLIMLIEFVHIRKWNENRRFVVSNVYNLIKETRRYQQSETQNHSNEKVKIEIFDFKVISNLIMRILYNIGLARLCHQL